MVPIVGESSSPFTVLDEITWRKKAHPPLSLNTAVYTGQDTRSSEGQEKGRSNRLDWGGEAKIWAPLNPNGISFSPHFSITGLELTRIYDIPRVTKLNKTKHQKDKTTKPSSSGSRKEERIPGIIQNEGRPWFVNPFSSVSTPTFRQSHSDISKQQWWQ